MTTFFASTFLHGLNFQLGAVLLSLGFFSFVEDKFRSRLSIIFDASIGARRNSNQNYTHQEGSFIVMLVNSGFGILTVIHLIYLKTGVMFDQSDLQSEGYHWNYTIEKKRLTYTIAKWKSLGFFSHRVIGIMFMFILLAYILESLQKIHVKTLNPSRQYPDTDCAYYKRSK